MELKLEVRHLPWNASNLSAELRYCSGHGVVISAFQLPAFQAVLV